MGKIYEIVSREVEYGLFKKHVEPGYVLENGIVLSDDVRDENGDYIGGAGMDGIYLRTPQTYRPVFSEVGDDLHLFGFERVR